MNGFEFAELRQALKGKRADPTDARILAGRIGDQCGVTIIPDYKHPGRLSIAVTLDHQRIACEGNVKPRRKDVEAVIESLKSLRNLTYGYAV